MFGATLVVLRLVAASGRVIGWILTAALVAGLLHPLVEGLARRIPRGAAVAVVFVGVLAVVGGISYAVVDSVVDQVAELQRAAPQAARELEGSERFGDAAREFDLSERVGEFVAELPERLRGGEVQDAVRSAATRGVAFLATGILTLFFLVHGRRILTAAVRQLPMNRRHLVRFRGEAVYERAWHYLAGSLAMAVMAGALAYGSAEAFDLPGAWPLALWMALWDLVPLLGVVVGAAPIVLLALAESPAEAAVIGVVLVGWQLFEAFELQPKVERRSVHIGPFVTVAVGMVGLELYGIGGALVSVALAVIAAATLEELAVSRR